MSLDLAHKVARLRGMALQFERGEMDAEFAAAIEAGVDVVPLREAMVTRCRQLADEIEAEL
jgi:hypothetical protein